MIGNSCLKWRGSDSYHSLLHTSHARALAINRCSGRSCDAWLSREDLTLFVYETLPLPPPPPLSFPLTEALSLLSDSDGLAQSHPLWALNSSSS
jgi:hypothetical protein